MKKIMFLLLISISAISQTRFYDENGIEIISPSRIQAITDSAYFASLPQNVTLTRLTKEDARKIRNLMLGRVQRTDKTYDYNHFLIFNKIVSDINTLPDTTTQITISNLSLDYVIEYCNSEVRNFESYIQYRDSSQGFLRVAKSVFPLDPERKVLGVKSDYMKQELSKELLNNQ